jgi:4a-hydroxytetrahydrobiopterin dehydratase
MPPLPEPEIDAALASLDGWTREGDEIVKRFERPSFLDGIAFVTRVAELAEAADHHPDIDIRWRTVRLALTTHDQGGLTQKDFDLAGAIDATA